ncbi:T9SS type A sorting domain-containing protein [Flammeovirga pacifica]|uniref:Secretion system C-terminal sorting domain-containing protein n=1 Tax=Flammeovirga pacifica TaxID=915059 RepID=A0A1S1Z3V4_FLAPC|nr:T9SS type A sorting domain-containing protein [Flammeovirga pacifica]OHX67912.1 hypothetical protein NH26_16985 [Flammeovirga pacifica]
MKNYILTLLILFYTLFTHAQNIGIVPSDDIPISKNAVQLKNPFFGGLNAPQFYNLDLNLNGESDLVIFDRTSRKVYTFLWNQGWEYAPEFENIFPQNIRFWMQLIDFNDDGSKDLIIGEEGGIYLYKNISTQNQVIFEVTPQQLNTTTFSGNPTPLSASLSDTPAIVDINGDGQKDFITFVPGLGGTIEAHLFQEEVDGVPSFKKTTNFWGSFQECGDCATYVFDNEQCPSGNRIMHLGSSITLFDINGNGLNDLIIGEKSCNNLVFLPNKGTTTEAVFDEYIINFPQNMPIDFPDFPAAYFIDTNNDQLQDMIVAPNIDVNDLYKTDFSKYIWRYQNTGTKTSPIWTLQEDDFLQNTGIDVGQRSRVTLYDVNGDGAQDLLIGYRNSYDENNQPQGGGITYLKNTGSNTSPAFEWVTDNYLNITEWGKVDIYPQVIDWNGDGELNLLISSVVPNSNQGGVYLFDINTPYSESASPTLIYEHRPDDVVYFTDINDDGKADILHGKYSGQLEYHQQNNDGTFSLVEESYLGVGADLLRKYPSAFVEDLDNDGNEDLLLWDDSGTPRIWRNFKSANPDYQGRAFFSNTDNEFISYTYGNRLNSVLLNNYLITSSESGGLTLGSLDNYNQPTSISKVDKTIDFIKVYPNPATFSVTIKNIGKSPTTLSIFNNLGQVMYVIDLKIDDNKKIDTHEWPRGMYFIKAANSNNSIQTKRLILQ